MKGSMSTYALDFEKPLLELETKLASSSGTPRPETVPGSVDTLDGEIGRLEKRCARLQQEIFNELSRWQVSSSPAIPTGRTCSTTSSVCSRIGSSCTATDPSRRSGADRGWRASTANR